MKFKRIDWEEGEDITSHFDSDTRAIIGYKIVSGRKDGTFLVRRSTTRMWQNYTDYNTFTQMQGLCYEYIVTRLRNRGVTGPTRFYAPY